MWSYYGAKTNVVRRYPPPKFGKIIEPFAGTARYSCLYWDREITLIDKYPVITDIWKWLQKCSKSDITKLPYSFKKGESISDIKFDCIEAKWLMGFLIAKGVERPRLTIVDRITLYRPNAVKFQLQRIASALDKIRHWKIIEGSYEDVPNEEATWFIDPPYQFGGHSYVKSSKHIDFKHLAEWSREREGHVIVCENIKADWMDFKLMQGHHGTHGPQQEAIWSNYPTAFDNEQIKMAI